MSYEKLTADDWGLLISRLTVFKTVPSAEEKEWWKELIEEPPEQINSRPNEGVYQSFGTFQNGKIELNIERLRVDWRYAVGLKVADSDLAKLDPFKKAQAPFFKLMGNWLNISPSINRLAYGANLIQITPSREEGYIRLSKYLPDVRIDPKNSTDFLYQINRPCISAGIDHLTINRLTKWSVMQLQFDYLKSNKEGGVLPSDFPGQKFAIHLEMDINTSQKFQKTFPKKKLISIFSELRSLGEEIAAKGDIK